MNLIFLCAAKNKPVGGIKVIHQLAETADGILSPQGGGAYLCHPNRPNFRTTWFTHQVRYRSARFGLRLRPKIGFSSIPRGCFDPTQDVVVLPELWVRKYALQLQTLGVPYIILVQAGYFIGKGNPTDMRRAYAAARAVWCVSDDTMECVRLAYPEASDRFHRFHVAVDADRFRPLTPKENWITYIPGKMPRHAELLRLFADPHLPPGWQWKLLQGLTETEMAETLGRSRIFVALAELEGFGLPPLEAALAGNIVIGHHAQGGREFWLSPVFKEVPQGDLLRLAGTLAKTATTFSDAVHEADSADIRQRLARTYSHQTMLADLTNLLNGAA
jgi:glycosyltransferase involved in cell wall biosynthesis